MKYVYFFGRGQADGDRSMKDLLGGKGANIAEMTNLGIPVPPGFTLTTEVCRHHLISEELPPGAREEVDRALARLEKVSGRRFGAETDPLLVSVRSGASVSMPGMMDTILNLGLSDASVQGLAEAAGGDERFAWDSYRRFVQMYGDVVLGVPHERFERVLREAREAAGVVTDSDISSDVLRDIVSQYKALIARTTDEPFPEDPHTQLWGAIGAVFRSWRNERAVAYRKTYGIPHDLGTAVNVQAMVYGNRGTTSGTGVAFTRSPSSGERQLFGEFLVNAQGEDVVAGIRDPLSIDEMRHHLPAAFEQLAETAARLESHYREMQDLEFTVEDGDLYLLQTRSGKRTARAAVRIAVEMAEEGLIDREEAVRRVEPERLEQVLHPMIDPEADVELVATGNPASPGAAAGRIVFAADEAVAAAPDGPVVLVREETSPDDFAGMVAAVAIVTSRGGKSSHAAVVARGMGKTCVVGTKSLDIDEEAGEIRAGATVLRRGDWITVDGSSGDILVGRVPTVQPEPGEQFERLMAWADGFRRLRVRANADNPEDAGAARDFGAEGIGLCRTEHMFLGEERVDAVREMILAGDAEGRRRALARLLPMQRGDFAGIFRAMEALPVTIRLLDPPLHEFLPDDDADIERLARAQDRSASEVRAAVERLRESNPMLGHRGCRLGYSHPELTRMQARAIFEAALDVREEGIEVRPEVMVPLVGHVAELRHQRALVDETAQEVFVERGMEIPYLVGTMIELPRACLTSGAIAGEAEFFSFGTNDLTQTTLGLSRDDAGTFLPLYVEAGVYARDPFQSLDKEGVGRLMRASVKEGRAARPGLKVGICGEHGGDPDSVAFCHGLGMDYVSCSPFRVPVARLAAAHAALADARPARPAES
ncbi:MAG: pyruvate, phosphate dikinase [Gemmatimonadota bacterium]|nr:pyruvate, phosphate dikinase [Gemmatimonadota bacterium]